MTRVLFVLSLIFFEGIIYGASFFEDGMRSLHSWSRHDGFERRLKNDFCDELFKHGPHDAEWARKVRGVKEDPEDEEFHHLAGLMDSLDRRFRGRSEGILRRVMHKNKMTPEPRVYKLLNEKYSADEATRMCKGKGGQLAVIRSDVEQSLAWEAAGNASTKKVFIGLRQHRDYGGSYGRGEEEIQWHDGTRVRFDKLKRYPTSHECGVILVANGKWNFVDCNQRLPALCEFRPIATVTPKTPPKPPRLPTTTKSPGAKPPSKTSNLPVWARTSQKPLRMTARTTATVMLGRSLYMSTAPASRLRSTQKPERMTTTTTKLSTKRRSYKTTAKPTATSPQHSFLGRSLSTPSVIVGSTQKRRRTTAANMFPPASVRYLTTARPIPLPRRKFETEIRLNLDFDKASTDPFFKLNLKAAIADLLKKPQKDITLLDMRRGSTIVILSIYLETGETEENLKNKLHAAAQKGGFLDLAFSSRTLPQREPEPEPEPKKLTIAPAPNHAKIFIPIIVVLVIAISVGVALLAFLLKRRKRIQNTQQRSSAYEEQPPPYKEFVATDYTQPPRVDSSAPPKYDECTETKKELHV